MEKSIPLLEQRKIEARTMAVLYESMKARLGEEQALEILDQALEAMALEAGKAYAATATDGPSFEHFKRIVDVWRGTGALTIERTREQGNTLCFDVTDCAYVKLYREIGLPDCLVRRLSCGRDAPFAKGYSERIVFQRTQTRGSGAAYCDFRFTWQDA